jgi:hypothetical protein
MPRQNPKDWNIEDIHKIVKSFCYNKEDLSFKWMRKRAAQKRFEKGSVIECTEMLFNS